jgi:hypothetical protein
VMFHGSLWYSVWLFLSFPWSGATLSLRQFSSVSNHPSRVGVLGGGIWGFWDSLTSFKLVAAKLPFYREASGKCSYLV